MICKTVFTEYQRVTDGRPDGRHDKRMFYSKDALRISSAYQQPVSLRVMSALNINSDSSYLCSSQFVLLTTLKPGNCEISAGTQFPTVPTTIKHCIIAVKNRQRTLFADRPNVEERKLYKRQSCVRQLIELQLDNAIYSLLQTLQQEARQMKETVKLNMNACLLYVFQ